MAAEPGRLTKRTVDALKPGETAWDGGDSSVKGFGVRRQRRDRVYMLKYRIAGRQRWYIIGPHGSPWTVESARTEAKRLLGKVAKQDDPAATRAQTKAAGTVAELCDLYLADAPNRVLRKTGQPKKASTLATDRGRIERHIKPLLGRTPVTAVTQDDIKRFLADVANGATAADIRRMPERGEPTEEIKDAGHKVTYSNAIKPRGRAIVEGGEGTATRTVGLLGGIFAYAVEKGMRPDNPVRGVARYKDRASKRYLSAAELAKLGEALAKAERDGDSKAAIAAIRLLILTGARKSEILAARRQWIDMARGYLHLPDSKTGEKLVPLGAPALAVIAALPRVEGNPYLLPGDKEGMHYIGLPKAWERIRSRAGLGDVRLHDLRHAFASVGASGGDSLLVIGALLGHHDAKTTQRYAHLQDDPIRAAANRISGTIAAAMAGKSASVMPIETRKRLRS